jgi:hypothetical protein
MTAVKQQRQVTAFRRMQRVLAAATGSSKKSMLSTLIINTALALHYAALATSSSITTSLTPLHALVLVPCVPYCAAPRLWWQQGDRASRV